MLYYAAMTAVTVVCLCLRLICKAPYSYSYRNAFLKLGNMNISRTNKLYLM